MAIHNYDDLNSIHIDALREVGSIGLGYAANSLSGVIGQKVSIHVPDVRLYENNAAIKKLGGPEKIISGVLVKFSGDIEGLILYIQTFDFINVVLKNVLSYEVESMEQLNEMQISALIEIGNIMISNSINAISTLTGLEVDLSVPAICVNMLGAIMTVPMVEFGYETDKIMLIDGKIICGGTTVDSNLLMMPTIDSLSKILKKLGVSGE